MTPNPTVTPLQGPSGDTSANPSPVNTATIRWDLSTPQARKASASEYRRGDVYKKKRSEKRQAKRANGKEQARNAAAKEHPTSMGIANMQSGGAGYTGSLRRKDAAVAEELWVDSERMAAMSSLVPVPYELSPVLLTQGNSTDSHASHQ